MLQVGVGGLSIAQQRSHFALWALEKAPLLIGANLKTISEDSLAILTAKEVCTYTLLGGGRSRALGEGEGQGSFCLKTGLTRPLYTALFAETTNRGGCG